MDKDEERVAAAAALGAGSFALVTALIYYLIDKGVIEPTKFTELLDRNVIAVEESKIESDLDQRIHETIENVISDIRQGIQQQGAS
jgi:hypothetical protein